MIGLCTPEIGYGLDYRTLIGCSFAARETSGPLFAIPSEVGRAQRLARRWRTVLLIFPRGRAWASIYDDVGLRSVDAGRQQSVTAIDDACDCSDIWRSRARTHKDAW